MGHLPISLCLLPLSLCEVLWVIKYGLTPLGVQAGRSLYPNREMLPQQQPLEVEDGLLVLADHKAAETQEGGKGLQRA